MSSFIQAMNNYTKKQVGENNHLEYGWSNKLEELFVQYYFQLVRSKDMHELELKLDKMLIMIKDNLEKYKKYWVMLYKLVGHTRDIIDGKGEYNLTYMQIYVWYKHYPELAKDLIKLCVLSKDNEHQYGSWKDLKYMCNYLSNKMGGKMEHELIEYCLDLYEKYIKLDWDKSENGTKVDGISLIARWVPREKSKQFGWIHHKLAYKMFSIYLDSANTNIQKNRAKRKCKMKLNKMITKLNRLLNTPQINMCGKEWSSINFNNVTSLTMRKNKNAFMNKDKLGKQKSNEEDRLECAKNFDNHVKASFNDETVKVHGKRCNVYELVKDALGIKHHEKSTERDVVNQQWKSNSENNIDGLGNIISVVDTSSSMHCDDYLPFYNAIGMGIRISEKCNPIFKNRFITFNDEPEWVTLSDNMDFVDKVYHTANAKWGGTTDFYKTMKLILDVCVSNNIPSNEVEDMVLAVFSDMQFNNSIKSSSFMLMENIKKLFIDAGYPNPPHILFWNLRKTTGFPTLSTENNVTMLSGYSATLLNIFCEKGFNELKKMTPMVMINELLDNNRYDILETYLKEYMNIMDFPKLGDYYKSSLTIE